MKDRIKALRKIMERTKTKGKELREKLRGKMSLKGIGGKGWYKLSDNKLADKTSKHVRRQRNIFAAYFMLVIIMIAAVVVGQGQRTERIIFEPMERQETKINQVETGKDIEEYKDLAQSSLAQGAVDLDYEKGNIAPAGQAEILDSLVWPAAGKITVRFHEVYKYQNQYRLHDGVDIQASEGQEVKAALAGTVEKVDINPILGETVILSHAGDIETIYGNLSEVKVVPGDSIEKGQTIAVVGNTALLDASQGYLLHFGLRVEGQYQDPQEYLP
ncbi:M23 family metallopeptidase [Candidatus Contubernalis alkaliaceticus]|uniref:M23 family metallopeptidase n=1 Tax=Candidatus Contubernalis alkaliaceticus TaxID=338645 RepID=UPI001F4BEC71|nr:M23 family metallopeptidase [Candidatus Contubernalis alkalaceticus]UNC93655.1 M23 family metallopeptidase [Candidatus Contubernalis alkalaceticus]